MSELQRIPGAQIGTGVHPSLPDSEVPLWRAGDNVVFGNGFATPGRGQAVLFPAPETGRALGLLSNKHSDGTNYAYWGTTTGLFQGTDPMQFPVGNIAEVSNGTYTGTLGDLWSIVAFGNFIFATNGVDEVQVLVSSGGPPSTALFDDMSNYSDLPGTFRAQLLRVLGPFLLAIGTDNSQQEVRWCSEDDTTLWTPEPANSARDIQLRDIGAEIIAAEELGNGLGLYSKDRLHILTFVGAPLFFGQDHLLTGIGAVSKASIVPVGRRHFGFGQDGIFVTDGSSFDYIDEPSVREFIYGPGGFDPALGSRVVGWLSDEERVYWSYPTDTLGATVCFDIRRGVWSTFTFYRTAATESAEFSTSLMSDTIGNIVKFGEGTGGILESDPLEMFQDQAMLESGYGELGYGNGGYGGTLEFLADDDLEPTIAIATKMLILRTAAGAVINLSEAFDAQSASVTTKTLDLGQVEWSKFLDQIFTQITERELLTNLSLKIYTADEDADDAFTLSQTIPLSAANPQNVLVPDSRFFRLQFEDSAITERWKLSQLVLTGEVVGQEY